MSVEIEIKQDGIKEYLKQVVQRMDELNSIDMHVVCLRNQLAESRLQECLTKKENKTDIILSEINKLCTVYDELHEKYFDSKHDSIIIAYWNQLLQKIMTNDIIWYMCDLEDGSPFAKYIHVDRWMYNALANHYDVIIHGKYQLYTPIHSKSIISIIPFDNDFSIYDQEKIMQSVFFCHILCKD